MRQLITESVLLTVFIFGIAPSLRSSRLDLRQELAGGAGRSTRGAPGWRSWQGLRC